MTDNGNQSVAPPSSGASSRRNFFAKAALATAVGSSVLMPAKAQAAAPGANINNRLHIIQRITMGVTPELLAEVKAIGVNAFIDQQLAPATLDDSLVESMLTGFTRLNQSSAALIAENRRGQIRNELNGATVLRAVHSRRQLQEVMVDFWSNHFNVDTNKKKTAMFKVAEDRRFRELALGKFSDLLMTSAKSPAMLEYLDNRRSRANRNRIPNENYARELMELHTLGVDGGYDETDVLEVAYVLSGWTVDNTTFEFKFDSRFHRLGPLLEGGDVLGWVPVAAEGTVENGESLLNFLARHPTTAQFICWKLCRHFVSDAITADDALVVKAAKVFSRNDTAIAPVLRTILRSKRFRQSKGEKVKRNNELLYAILRATTPQFDLSDAPLLGGNLRQSLIKLGHPLFECEPPTGYPDVAGAFINTNTMVNRWNLGFALAGNTFLRRVQVDNSQWVGSPGKIKALVNQLSTRLLGRQLSAAEKQSLYDYLGKTERSKVTADDLAQVPALAGLIFASSSYQVR